MRSGFKIADAYVEIHADKDTLSRELDSLPADIGRDADRAGSGLGTRVGRSMGDGVVSGFRSSGASKVADEVGKLSEKLTAAQRAEKSSADAVQLAEMRLSEARSRGNVSGSRMLALEQSLDKARQRGIDATSVRVRLERDLENVVADAARTSGPKAEEAGRDTGDKLSRGMNLALVRNAPLIAAGIAGALALGAPAVLAAGGALFIGLAALAVHSSEDLQATFKATGTQIGGIFTQAAQVTIPMFQQALHRLGDGVAALQPDFTSIFEALGVPIDSLTTGILRMTDNLMPGLIAVVRAGGPVFQGLSDLLASTGSGLSDFFSILSEHAPAAGTVMSSLGSTLSALLPILGQLIGVGTELAAQVLPPVAAILHGVASALNTVAPILPVVVGGFLAFKAVSALSGPLDLLSAKLQTIAADGGRFTTALAGNAAAGVSKLGAALPVIGIGLGLLTAAFEMDQKQVNDWARALLDGGQAAATANAEMAKQTQFVQQNTTGFRGFMADLLGTGNALRIVGSEQDRATQKAKELYDAMTPLQQRQQDVTKATNDLELAIQTYGSGSGQAIGASVQLKDKQDALTRAQGELERATHGVTQALLDEANQALAMADSNFALEAADLRTQEAEKNITDAIKAHGASSLEAQTAVNDFNQALTNQAAAAGKAAADSSGLTDKMELQKVSAAGVLRELYVLRQEYGDKFPVDLQRSIDRMEAAGVKLDWLGDKKPTPTADLNTTPLDTKSDSVFADLANIASQHPTPTADLNKAPFSAGAQQTSSTLNWLAGLSAHPLADLNAGPFQFAASQTSGTMSYLNNLRSYPWIIAQVAGLTTAEAQLNWASRPRYATIYTTVSGGPNRMVATGGNIGDVMAGPGYAEGGQFFSGQVHGPGGMFDDLVQAVNELGQPLRVSNLEWVINGPVSQRQGAAKMAALNAGRADIVPRGGSSSGSSGGADGARPIVIQSLTVQVQGTFDLASSQDLDKAARVLVARIRKVDRELN